MLNNLMLDDMDYVLSTLGDAFEDTYHNSFATGGEWAGWMVAKPYRRRGRAIFRGLINFFATDE